MGINLSLLPKEGDNVILPVTSGSIMDGAVIDSNSPGSLSFLLKETHFNIEELKKWHKIFYKDCPNGLLLRKDFLLIYERFFPFGNCKKYTSLHYRAMDLDNDDNISFSDYIRTLSIWSRGTLEERSNFIHRAMDLDSNHLITNDDLKEWVIGILELIGDFNYHYSPLTERMSTLYGKQKYTCNDGDDNDDDDDDDIIEIYMMDIITNVFKSDDLDICLSKKDLLRIVQSNPEILKSLLVFDGSL